MNANELEAAILAADTMSEATQLIDKHWTEIGRNSDKQSYAKVFESYTQKFLDADELSRGDLVEAWTSSRNRETGLNETISRMSPNYQKYGADALPLITKEAVDVATEFTRNYITFAKSDAKACWDKYVGTQLSHDLKQYHKAAHRAKLPKHWTPLTSVVTDKALAFTFPHGVKMGPADEAIELLGKSYVNLLVSYFDDNRLPIDNPGTVVKTKLRPELAQAFEERQALTRDDIGLVNMLNSERAFSGNLKKIMIQCGLMEPENKRPGGKSTYTGPNCR
ncbi:MAG: hypothetical protein LBL34_01300 [Clostridiales bacterium]|jgi:hypothetical protein|nr:hypothetical protein [Clostridiales bacterium]